MNLRRIFLLPVLASSICWYPVQKAHQNTANFNLNGPLDDFVAKSVLATGEWYQLSLSHNGLYKLDYNFFKSELKLNIDQINPQQLKFFGHRGGPLPTSIFGDRQDDLAQIAVWIQGESDNSFDPQDYVLIYAEGPSTWAFNENDGIDRFTMNPFSSSSFIYLRVDGEPGLRIAQQPATTSGTVTDVFDEHVHFEEDKVNLLSRYGPTIGSGQQWFGDNLSNTRTKDYSSWFKLPNRVTGSPIRLISNFAGRAEIPTAYYVRINNDSLAGNIAWTDVGDVESTYARQRLIDQTLIPEGKDLKVTVSYPTLNGANSEGWLDYLEIHTTSHLSYPDSAFTFRWYSSTASPFTTYRIQSAKALTVWNISNPIQPGQLPATFENGQVLVNDQSSTLQQYLVFDPDDVQQKPRALGAIPNQDLHGIQGTDMVILYHPDFEEAAQRLANHRRSFSKLRVEAINITRLYHEFSAGKTDPTAIRDFARMLHERDSRFRYLLLFGDASYDYRHLDTNQPDQNFIPTYETTGSLEPIFAYPTDDYFGLLDDSDDRYANPLRGKLDIAIGRLPVNSPTMADQVVDKIIGYDTNSNTFGDWKLRIGMVADDEQDGAFVIQNEGLAKEKLSNLSLFNLEKIYFDAFVQEITPSSERYPTVKTALSNDLFKGLLVINYLGHGGPGGWADERVLEINDINSLRNKERLPLFVTATCSFTAYDDPSNTSGGELCLTNPNGGGIGLFTTVRSVYLSSNYQLTLAVFEEMFKRDSTGYRTIGEILMRAKATQGASDENARKFTLIGDPALKLAIPPYQVVTESINTVPISELTDTLRALQRVSISGEIWSPAGLLANDFNGDVYVTIYDKPSKVSTLQQNSASPRIEFDIQKNILYKGKAPVDQGKFNLEFIVPKDINYTYGPGKISYYAEADQRDAWGVYENIVIGGTSPVSEADNEGPIIGLYMNNTLFKNNGITDEHPILLVELEDSSGINVSGNSIGHDLEAILDEDTRNRVNLNTFYEASPDRFNAGTVRYPYADLAPGPHQIRVKAWDIYNNNSEATIDFVVVASSELRIASVSAYPNPAQDEIHFVVGHNGGSGALSAEIYLYNTLGQKLAVLQGSVSDPGYQTEVVVWGNLSEAFPPLSSGVYFYEVVLKQASGGMNKIAKSDLQKLVITR
ncbi:MAG: type IX secretion system sortase PorU [Saprospiraceae bacterium]|nr:type IX secretion system sortase PorU [Saprospiraceae bacterium]